MQKGKTNWPDNISVVGYRETPALRSLSCRARVSCDLQYLGVNIYCVHQPRFSNSNRECILSMEFHRYSGCFDGGSRGFSRMMSMSLDSACALVFEYPEVYFEC